MELCVHRQTAEEGENRKGDSSSYELVSEVLAGWD